MKNKKLVFIKQYNLIESKHMNYLQINLKKNVHELYSENHKTLLKEIKEGMSKQRQKQFMGENTQHF